MAMRVTPTRFKPPFGMDAAERRAVTALALIAPAVARAHGEQAVFGFLYFPPLAVITALAIGTWNWKASRKARTRSFLAVALTAIAISVINYKGEGLAAAMEFGASGFFLGILAQIGLPALVWGFCKRLARRRGEEG